EAVFIAFVTFVVPSSAAASLMEADRVARPMPDPIQYLRSHEEEHLRELMDWLRIPSVSAQPAKHGKDLERAADMLATMLRHAGAENVQLIPTANHGNPIVY